MVVSTHKCTSTSCFRIFYVTWGFFHHSLIKWVCSCSSTGFDIETCKLMHYFFVMYHVGCVIYTQSKLAAIWPTPAFNPTTRPTAQLFESLSDQMMLYNSMLDIPFRPLILHSSPHFIVHCIVLFYDLIYPIRHPCLGEYTITYCRHQQVYRRVSRQFKQHRPSSNYEPANFQSLIDNLPHNLTRSQCGNAGIYNPTTSLKRGWYCRRHLTYSR